MMVSSFVIGALLALTFPTAVSQRPATPLPAIPVFVETDDSGETGELAARQSSVKDLAASLATKRKTIAVVEDEDKATIVVEVIGRALTIPKVMIGLGPRPGQSSAVGPTKTGVLRVRLTVGEYAVDFTNKNKAADTPRGWKSAADDLADQIDKWLLEHRAEIVR